MLDQALALAAKGFRVFPCAGPTAKNPKLPILQRWPERATTDLDTIKTWWSGAHTETSKKNKTYKIPPNANIGIATGEDVIIIDVDTAKTEGGSDGFTALRQLISEGLPPTYTVRTPTGGLHLYYRAPGRPVKTVAGWRPGVDVRGVGGQGVGPGSKTGAGTYEIYRDVPLATLPLGIAAELPYRAPASQADDRLNANRSQERTDDIITTGERDYSVFPESIPHGEHDETLFKYACSWRTRGIPEATAAILMQELVKRCEGAGADAQEMGSEKLANAYGPNYQKPEWVPVVAASGETTLAKREDITTMAAALERFAFIEAGNRVVDLQEPPHRAVRQLEEFKNSWGNVYVDDKQLPRQWLGHPSRQTLRDTTYFPKDKRIIKQDGAQLYNLYTGSDLTDIPKSNIDLDQIQIFLNHVKYLIPTRPDAALFLKWFAATVQRPERRVQWAPLITGNPGTGKSWFYYLFERLLGQQNCAIIGPEHLDMSFNEFMSGTTLVCIDEMHTKSRWDVMERLKPLITEKRMEINRKYGAKGLEAVFPNFICFSNHRDAAALKADDRRFWVCHSEAVQRDADYYVRLFDWLHTEGPAHLRAWAMSFDLTGFSWGAAPPMTRAKQHMIAASRSLIETTILEGIEDRDDIFRFDIVDPSIVENYIRNTLDMDRLSASDKLQVSHTLSNLTSVGLPQDRYRVHLNGRSETRRRRLKPVRNFERWHEAPGTEIIDEYGRAWMVSMGQDIKPELKAVEK